MSRIVFKTKDELRVERSIASIARKIIASMEKSQPDLLKREREFEELCKKDGIIYFPKYI